MRGVIACLIAVVVAITASACGPDQPQKDWSKYSAPLSAKDGRLAVQGGEQPVG